MLLVGLTGGLASGKTTIARIFQSYGAEVIDADDLAREVTKKGRPAWKAIVKSFGKSILNSDQSIDRPSLAKIVFQSSGKLRTLTGIIYPRVAREQARLVRQIKLADPNAVIIYDAAMLIEALAHHRMDQIIVVNTNRATQITRACQRSGFTRADALHRIRNQMPIREKLRYADYVIDGTLPVRQLRSIVKPLYTLFHKQAKAAMNNDGNEDQLKY